MKPEDLLQVRVKRDECGQDVIIAEGEIDTYTIPCLEKYFEIIGNTPKGVIVDLQGIKYIEGVGVNFLIRFSKKAEENNKSFQVRVKKGAYIVKVLRLVQFTKFEEIINN